MSEEKTFLEELKELQQSIGKVVIEPQIAFNDKNVQDTIEAIMQEVDRLAKQSFQKINIIVEKNIS